MKKVSIIIPVKEINDYIRESLPEIENLDYDKSLIEVIVLPDNEEKVEGTASINATGNGVQWNVIYEFYNPSGKWDWSMKDTIKFWFKSNETGSGMIYFYVADTSYWTDYYAWEISPGSWNTWEEFTIDLKNPESTAGNLDLSNVDMIYFAFNQNDGGEIFHIDDIRIGYSQQAWSNVTKTLNSTEGAVVQWRVYANDTSGNINASEIFTLTTTDGQAPRYWDNSTNSTLPASVTDIFFTRSGEALPKIKYRALF